MSATQQLLERYKQFHEIESDYAAAKRLGVTRATVSKWRNGGTMDAATIAQIAHDLRIDFDAALAEVSLERPVSERDRAIWERLRARVSVAILAAIAAQGLMQQSDAEAAPQVVRHAIHYAHVTITRRVGRLCSSLGHRMLSALRRFNGCALSPFARLNPAHRLS